MRVIRPWADITYKEKRNLFPECSRGGPEVISLLPEVESQEFPPWQPSDTLPRLYPETDSCAYALFSHTRKLVRVTTIQIPLNIFCI